jgi:hypothetical protein
VVRRIGSRESLLHPGLLIQTSSDSASSPGRSGPAVDARPKRGEKIVPNGQIVCWASKPRLSKTDLYRPCGAGRENFHEFVHEIASRRRARGVWKCAVIPRRAVKSPNIQQAEREVASQAVSGSQSRKETRRQPSDSMLRFDGVYRLLNVCSLEITFVASALRLTLATIKISPNGQIVCWAIKPRLSKTDPYRVQCRGPPDREPRELITSWITNPNEL